MNPLTRFCILPKYIEPKLQRISPSVYKVDVTRRWLLWDFRTTLKARVWNFCPKPQEVWFYPNRLRRFRNSRLEVVVLEDFNKRSHGP